MNDPLQNRFKLQIESLTGFDFQDFVVDLFLLKYGEQGFTVLRKKKDKGCDGIINNEKRIIACYGPENATQKKFDNKADEDFEDYQNNWEKKYPKWMFIVNQNISPAQINKIESLKSGTPLLGTQQILSIIEDLKNYQRRKLAKSLRIESEFLAQDYLREILEDLLKESEPPENKIPYNKALYYPDKVKLNYKEADIEGVLQEYEIVSEYFIDIHNVIYGYEDGEIDRIKLRIINDFTETKGIFKEKLETLTKLYLEKYSSNDDDDYRFYVRALLIYIFEQCLIGRKTKQENDITTP